MSWQEQRSRALEVLRNTFGFEGFRGVQEDAIKAALQGRDVFVLMPTGGGKSLCYALPAAVTGGLVLVVSPLIALMQDQVAALQSTGVPADYLSSTRTAAERKHLLDQLTPTAAAAALAVVPSKLAMLYVTPELIATDSFRQRLRAVHAQCPGYIKLVAVDEAHCISQWGHDYRPTYRQLSKLRAVLRGVPCMALTATATPQVREDILSSLQLSNPAVLTSSFNRPNIHYSILLLDVQASDSTSSSAAHCRPSAGSLHSGNAGRGLEGRDPDEDGPSDDADHAGYGLLLQLLKPHGGRQRKVQSEGRPAAEQQEQQQEQSSGSVQKQWPGPIAIVYALKRATVDTLSRRLRAEGLAAAAYHAALPAATRAEVLQKWRAGQLQVVVASVAFGMGVDKGDIELVVHYNLPRSIEAFYQESGRAGRNGQPARSVLMYANRDRRRMDWILQQDANKKASRKRKKQSEPEAATASSTGHTAGSTPGGFAAGSDAADGPVDPAAAAAAHRAFGGVVELCCTAGCRRRRLLQHFGETLLPQPHPQQAAPNSDVLCCCDFCDSPALVQDAVQRLQQCEQELVQRRFHSSSAAQPGGNKRRKTAGYEAYGFVGSSEEEGEEGISTDEEAADEATRDVEAALLAARRQAAAGAGQTTLYKPGASPHTSSRSPADTDTFLKAMLRAEQAHERRAAAAAAGTGDRLEQLMTKQGRGKEAQASLLADMRRSRQSKLAEVLASNSSLEGCSRELAAELASQYEASAAAGCGADAVAHKARMLQLLKGCKAATSWLELPELQLLTGPALEAALRHGVAAVAADARQCTQQPGSDAADAHTQKAARAEAGLQRLAQLRVTADALEATGVAAEVKKLRKHSHPAVAAAASRTVVAWRESVSSAS